MNETLLNALSNPAFDLEEAEKIMHAAGQEIVRLERRIKELTDYNHKLKEEVEKLSLDLGFKDACFKNYGQH